MTSRTIVGGREAWVGSGAPNTKHLSPPKLKLHSLSCFAFIKRTSPVPPGDAVGVGRLSVWVAKSATGTFTLKARRVASAPEWGKLTFNNQPGVTGTWQPTVTVTNPVAGQRLDFDVKQHLSTIAGGGKEYGWRIESDSNTDLWLYGDDSPMTPALYVEFSALPAIPTDLVPAGVISVGKPVVSATADDVTGEDEVAKVQWQLDAASDAASPDFDSGLVDAEALELDLGRTDLPGGVFAGMADGATIYQRCRWQNDSGVNSGWSDWYPITRKAKPVATISNPSSGVVHDITPILLATVPATVETYLIRVVDPADPSRVLASSRKQKTGGATTISWEVPAHVLVDGETYRAQFDTWDDEARVQSPGDPRYGRAIADFTIDEVTTVETPHIVSVAAHPTLPANVITVTTSTPPDTFTIYQDGDVHDVKLDAVDAFISGSTYQLLDFDFTWMEPHTYQVRSVQDGKQSPKSNQVSITTTPSDVWIIDPGTGRSFMLAGTGIDDWGRVDNVAEYQVHGSDLSVVIKAGSTGYKGSFKGAMRAAHGRSLASLRKDVTAMEKYGTTPVLLRAANLTKWVVLLDLSHTPHPDTRESSPRDQVSLRFVQAPKPQGA